MKLRKLSIGVLTGLFLLWSWGAALAASSGPAAGSAASPMTAPVQAAQPSQKGAASLPPTTGSATSQAPVAMSGAVPPTEADDIRDIRGPLHIPNPFMWAWYSMGAFLVLVAGAALWRWLRKHKALRAKRAYEIAFEELERAKALMTPEQANAFSVAVSNTIRTYIEKRFEVRVTRHTTEEFMARLQSEPAGDLNEYSDSLRDFLSHCDLAKFARFLLTADQMEKMHQSAWQFVDKTRPRAEEKKALQSSEVPDAATNTIPDEKTSRKRFIAGMIEALQQRFNSKKATADAAFGAGSAVAAGGR